VGFDNFFAYRQAQACTAAAAYAALEYAGQYVGRYAAACVGNGDGDALAGRLRGND